MRHTKVIATVGPATDAPEVLEKIISAGVDVVRLNAAHSEPPELERAVGLVRRAAEAVGRDVAILVDLPGPKIRLGDIAPGTVLEAGDGFSLVDEECIGDSTRACVTHLALTTDVRTGNRVLLDDGRIELAVTSTAPGVVNTRVVTGGELLSHKGVNVPGVRLSVDAITDYDRTVLEWACASDVDWIGQSFVRSPHDVEALRDLMGENRIPIVAKIEKHEAVDEIDAVLVAADAVMVARGDLAVETAPERVPVLQLQIIAAARAVGKPVVVATEMLDSMRERPHPTRAEASDVANAIFNCADGVMLSGETAVGAYPVQAVETMVRIILEAESVASPADQAPAHQSIDDVQRAMSTAVCDLAADLGVAAIVPLTQSGATAFAVSRHRPDAPIIAATPNLCTSRKLALAWGVRSVVIPFTDDAAELLDSVTAAVCAAGFAKPGERVALTAGLWARTPGGTDFVHVRSV
ncbi:MAG TPA: pyruvate kinase [Coriobacteriia bacterium]|nr:pyruvate kinase [Coriobacteriia bacterium]